MIFFMIVTVAVIEEKGDPCRPSPCGPNSQCRDVNGQGVCSCLPGYQGSPPGCRPECVVSSECPQNRACNNQKCTDPCIGTCGLNAKCQVINHSPICTCTQGYTGDPFSRCQPIPRKYMKCNHKCEVKFINLKIHILATPVVSEPTQYVNPCYPSPCGPNSQCREINDSPSCSCLPTFIGSPPNCRAECNVNSECSSNKACMRQKCNDPCPGSCGYNAECNVINHTPMCTCKQGFTGDPFTECKTRPPQGNKKLLLR